MNIFFIALFATLAVLAQFKPITRRYSFALFVITAALLALSYPSYFLVWGTFELKRLIVPLLMIIMFGMGSTISAKDFLGVIKMPKAVGIGLLCQFTIMPIIGFTLASFSGLPPAIAAGIILVGCSPSGLASNVMSYISGANVALSLTLTVVATLLSPLITPLLMKIFADQLIPIDFLSMLWSIVKMVIIPIVAGVIFNKLIFNKYPIIAKIMPLVSMIGIAVIIVIITANGRENLITIGVTLIAIVIIHNVLGYLFGYYLSILFGMDKKSARTIAFEVGLQNAGLASGIALEMGRVATMGLAPAVFGPLMNISGSTLAGYWHKKNDKSDTAEANE